VILFTVEQTAITGVVVAENCAGGDTRGAFSRLFCVDELAQWLGDRKIVQINHSCTRQTGGGRGLHYQLPPAAEMKMVRLIALVLLLPVSRYIIGMISTILPQ